MALTKQANVAGQTPGQYLLFNDDNLTTTPHETGMGVSVPPACRFIYLVVLEEPTRGSLVLSAFGTFRQACLAADRARTEYRASVSVDSMVISALAADWGDPARR